MSNYSKTVNFAIKDSLSTGDPNKLILGAELGTEFDNIATAIATKAESSTTPVLTANNIFVQAVNSSNEQRITNSSAGAAADALLKISNGTRFSYFGMAGTGYSSTEWTGGPTGEQTFIGNNGTVPISIATNNTERIRIAGDGASINLRATDIQLNGQTILSLQAIKAATTGRNTTTTLADDPDLTIAIPVAGTYEIRMLLLMTGATAAAQGFKYQLVYTGTAGTIGYYTIGSINGAASTPLAAAGAFNVATHATVLVDSGAGATTDFDHVVGTFVATTTGTLKLQWAQSTSTGNNSNLKANSLLMVRKVA